MLRNNGVPDDISHLALIWSEGGKSYKEAFRVSAKHVDDSRILGTALCAMYQAATCHRECHGGGHMLERLVGRAYNLCCASYNLILLGFYDEALSLVRSVTEVNNLIALSVFDKEAIAEWLAADKKTRLKKYSPAKVRSLLKQHTNEDLGHSDWYTDLCETYVHVTPKTMPNMHAGRSQVGGRFQEQGIKKALDELSTAAALVAMLVCKYFQYDDLFVELIAHVAHVKSHQDQKS
jgi:hypothetical protein